jgi:hypothetical protein
MQEQSEYTLGKRIAELDILHHKMSRVSKTSFNDVFIHWNVKTIEWSSAKCRGYTDNYIRLYSERIDGMYVQDIQASQ